MNRTIQHEDTQTVYVTGCISLIGVEEKTRLQTAFLIQLILNGITTGLIISLGALGITLVFGTVRFSNVAAGDMATFGAYAVLTVASVSGSMILGIAGGIDPALAASMLFAAT